MKHKFLFLGIVFLVLALPLLAMGQKATSYPKPTGTLVVALNEMQSILDPTRVAISEKYYLSSIFESFIGADRNGLIKSDFSLAEKWESSPDGKMWTFHIRKGVKFHNGDELTAEDVKFTVDRLMGPKSLMSYAGLFRASIDRIEVLDPYTVRFYCKKPTPELLYYLGPDGYEGLVLPKKYIEEKGDVYFGLHPVGTAPYKVVELVGGSHIKLEAAFDSHWLYGSPKYQNLIFKHVPEELTRISMIRTGEADIARISPERVGSVEAAGFKVVEDPGSDIPFIFMTEQWVKEAPVSNKKVRQALALAINREEIFKHIFYGMGRLTGSPTTIKRSQFYIDLPIYPYDPETAKKLLKEAGYPNGFKIQLWSFPIEAFPSLPRTLEVIAGYLEKIGVKAEIVPYADYQSVRPKFMAKETGGVIFGNDSGGRSSPLRAMFLWFHSSSGPRLAQAPELDTWISAAQSTMNDKERMELIQKIDRYVNDNYHFLFAAERNIPYAISKKLEPWDMGYQFYDINLEKVLMWNSPK
jgi:peptide/nickel transport system substrate-binding protein